MNTNTDPEQPLRAIAYLANQIRPDWATPGILAALRKRQDEPLADLALAAIHAAANRDDQRTPAVIAMDGPHWRIQPADDEPPAKIDRGPRCHICGLERDLHTRTIALCHDHDWQDPRTAPALCARCGLHRDHHTRADHPWTSTADYARQCRNQPKEHAA